MCVCVCVWMNKGGVGSWSSSPLTNFGRSIRQHLQSSDGEPPSRGEALRASRLSFPPSLTSLINHPRHLTESFQTPLTMYSYAAVE